MKRILASTLICLLAVAGSAAVRLAVPEKLAALLTATNDAGKPVITPEQRTYFEGLNDHITALLSNATETEIITRPDHLGSILALGLRPQKMEVLLQDNCVLCHTDPEVQKAETLFSLAPPGGPNSHLNLRHLVDDIHFARGLSCSGCHGGDPASDKLEHSHVKEWPGTARDKDRAWVLSFCARCHSDPALMNRFNPALPTDQLAKFRESPHGKLLIEAKDSRAPDCLSCHGVHGIRNAKNPLSTVNPKRVHDTCGACHANPAKMAGFKLPDGSPLPTNQVAQYRASVHGRALLERGDLGAPTCNSCHGNHAAMPVGLSSVSQSCGLCHAGAASLFDGSKHKKAFEEHKWAQCAKCHGNHGILKTHDAMLSSGPRSLCVECHAQYAKENPECSASAEHFYATITRLDQDWNRYNASAEQLAAKGLDVDPIHDQLGELADTIKQARAHVHAFSRNSFDQVAAPGNKAADTISSLVSEARSEYRVRQTGLAASIGLIGLVMITVYLKLRRLERQADEPNRRPLP